MFFTYIVQNKCKKHEKVCNYNDYCYVEIPNEHNKLLKYKNRGKSMKAPFIIYVDLEYLLEKMHSCRDNPEKSYTEKNKHTTSGYSLLTNFSFDSSKNKADCYIKIKTVWRGFVKT